MATRTAPTLADFEEARRRLDGVARVTPVYSSETLSRLTGRKVWLKAENLQRTGSFKIRGAFNRISTLAGRDGGAGVVAASAGNHGQAVAWAAREVGVPATVFVPQDAPMAKVEACRNYGAKTVMTGAYFEDALAAITPAERSVGESVESLLTAPRILNDPVRWRFSAFSRTSRPHRRENVSDR